MATDLTDAKASANPTKAFFVRMITKDLFLEDCILDLIDNSVDGAWRTEGNPPMGLSEGADLSKYSISIALSPTSFSIIDNCGGMTLDDAVKHAFSFGRTATEANQDYSIGVYGIGMKRAVFKLGTDVKIRSTFTDDNKQRLPFAVPINVPVWAANDAPPWDFDIEPDEPHPANGSIQHPRRPQIWQTTSSPTLAVASGWRSSIKSIPAGSQ
ncbi:MAG: ATP-binding protein, partial [Terriglobia bacterium]